MHDLRGTFVTVALANGKSESWISDRTGHRSSVMIARYKRTARTFSELQLGELARLDEVIPELIGHGLATDFTAISESSMTAAACFGAGNGIRSSDTISQAGGTAEVPQESVDARPPSSPIVAAAGQSGGNQEPLDAVEAALAEALRKAAAESQWAAVETLSRELTARREARAGVVQLAAERKRRGGLP